MQAILGLPGGNPFTTTRAVGLSERFFVWQTIVEWVSTQQAQAYRQQELVQQQASAIAPSSGVSLLPYLHEGVHFGAPIVATNGLTHCKDVEPDNLRLGGVGGGGGGSGAGRIIALGSCVNWVLAQLFQGCARVRYRVIAQQQAKSTTKEGEWRGGLSLGEASDDEQIMLLFCRSFNCVGHEESPSVVYFGTYLAVERELSAHSQAKKTLRQWAPVLLSGPASGVQMMRAPPGAKSKSKSTQQQVKMGGIRFELPNSSWCRPEVVPAAGGGETLLSLRDVSRIECDGGAASLVMVGKAVGLDLQSDFPKMLRLLPTTIQAPGAAISRSIVVSGGKRMRAGGGRGGRSDQQARRKSSSDSSIPKAVHGVPAALVSR
jgi:hypothetical protein